MSSPIYIVRHGLTDWNAEARLQGQAETDINAVGRAQATANGIRLAALVGRQAAAYDFVASPMLRTRHTMELVRAAMGLPRDGYRTDPRLVELSFGDWQGYTLAELERLRPGCTAGREADKWHFVPPGAGAESYQMLTQRVRPWLAALAPPMVCVVHGGVVRAIFRIIENMAPELAANLPVPQDRILELRDGRLTWL